MVLLIAGCNPADNAAENTAAPETQSSLPSSETDVEVPQKVVVLNSTNAEILHALGKDGHIVGVDGSAQSLGYPYLKEVKDLGHPFRPNVEGIVALRPDLVLATRENLEDKTAEQLRAAGLEVKILEESWKDGLDGLYRRIREIAQLFREEAKGEELVASIEADAAALQKRVDQIDKKPKVFFLYAHGPSDSFITGTDSGSDVLIRLAGGENAASFTTGRKALTAEAMVNAAPDAIIMLKRGMDAVGGVDGALKLPGVELTPAGKNRKIITVDDSIRWVGPRFPQFAEELFEELHK